MLTGLLYFWRLEKFIFSSKINSHLEIIWNLTNSCMSANTDSTTHLSIHETLNTTYLSRNIGGKTTWSTGITSFKHVTFAKITSVDCLYEPEHENHPWNNSIPYDQQTTFRIIMISTMNPYLLGTDTESLADHATDRRPWRVFPVTKQTQHMNWETRVFLPDP